MIEDKFLRMQEVLEAEREGTVEERRVGCPP
jgi:hypothetical protein